MILNRWIAFAVVGAAFAQAGSNRLAAQSQAPTLRTRVEVVQLDVSVLDRDRRPVRGLTAQDFTVLEDGKPRPVAGFHAFDASELSTSAAGALRDVPVDVVTNSVQDARLFVVVVDDGMIPQRPEFIRDTKAIVNRIIEGLAPSDLGAVVFTADNRNAQEFTSDRQKLRAALDRFNPGLSDYRFGIDTGGVDINTSFHLSSIRTLTAVCDHLMDVPNRRKVVFWLSPGIPFDLEDAKPREAPKPNQAGAPAMARAIDMRDIADRVKELHAHAQRAHAVIYPIDPTGLGGMRGFIEQRLNRGDVRVREYFRLDELPDPVRNPERDYQSFVSTKVATLTDFLAQTASSTGGRVVMNTNDWEPGISEIFRENEAYYLLGFEPATPVDGRLHRIEVTVNRPDLEVRSRRSYQAETKDAVRDKAAAAVSPENKILHDAIAGLLPEAGLPMRLVTAPLAVPGQRLSDVAVVLGITQPIPAAAQSSRITATTELRITAFTPEGQTRGDARHTAKVVIRPGASGEASYEVLGRISLPAGRYRLRIAAHELESRKTGSVFTDVTVPDFSNASASASAIVFGASPGRANAPKDLLSALLPFAPTAEREFVRSDKVTALLRVYQNGQKSVEAARVTIRIQDAQGALAQERIVTIPPDQFQSAAQTVQQSSTISTRPPPPPQAAARGAAPPAPAVGTDVFANLGLRSADAKYEVPTSRLSPGAYALTMETVVGSVVLQRQVRFSIK